MRLTLTLACSAFAATAAAAQSVPAYTLSAPNAMIKEAFSRVLGVAELTDKRVLVVDFKDGTLTIADFANGSRAQLGRNGSGPNEYIRVAGVARRLADTLYVMDGGNWRYLRIDGTGKLAGTLAFPARAREFGSPRGVDALGRFYWTGGVVSMHPVTGAKRNQRSQVMRWDLVADSLVSVADFTDHAPELHENKFFPYAERDSWVIDAKGRVGIVVARDYHLRWIENGKVVFDGAPIPFQRIAVNARERDAFRAEKEAQGPAGSGQARGATSDTGRSAPAARRTMLDYYPDAMFPATMPPFVENGARLSPRGDIWVERSRAPSDLAPRFDVLGVDGKLRATVQFPASTQLAALDRNGIYLLRIDGDGLQTLERHSWPATLR
jgi:hypothetical protein